jgi:DNA modification methylase
MLGRKFIGCEISENYYKIAEARIKAGYAQSRLF